jgi:hypothetical protein
MDELRSPNAAQPTTLFGLFIQAAATRQDEERMRLLAEIDQTGNQNFHYGAVSVFLAAVRSQFADRDLHEVACFVKRMYAQYSHAERLWPLETEMLMRDALGDRVPLDGIDIPESEMNMIVVAGIAADFGWTLERLNGVIVQGERYTAERGFPLTPAPPPT